MAREQLDWTREEIILAMDFYVRAQVGLVARHVLVGQMVLRGWWCDTNTLSNNADRRSSTAATVHGLRRHDPYDRP